MVVTCPKCGKEVIFISSERREGDGLYSAYRSKMEIEDSDEYGCGDLPNCHYRISGKEYKKRLLASNSKIP